MICADEFLNVKVKNPVPGKGVLCSILVLVAAASLAACHGKAKQDSQTLARVDGQDITILQLNDEISHAGVQAGQQDAANKQFLEALIDRQLILDEAMRSKIDRSPAVMQAVERAKAQIISQEYLKSIVSKVERPTPAEIDDYYQKHPEFFAKRKEFQLKQLAFPKSKLSDELKSVIDSAKTLEEVAAWMDKHGMVYGRRQVTRSSTDLPQQAVAKLQELPKGAIFMVQEGDNTLLNTVVSSQDTPVSAANASPQIAQFLFAQKSKDAVQVELAHLRSLAKIEYVNASAPVAAPTQAAVSAPAAAPGNSPVQPK